MRRLNHGENAAFTPKPSASVTTSTLVNPGSASVGATRIRDPESTSHDSLLLVTNCHHRVDSGSTAGGNVTCAKRGSKKCDGHRDERD